MKNYDDSEMINKLILDGGLEVAAMDNDTGELLYSFTPKIKEIMPELYQEHMHNVNSEIMNLWEKGFINLDLFQPDPVITLTIKALNLGGLLCHIESEQKVLTDVLDSLH